MTASLLLVFLIAKIAATWARSFVWTPWTPLALFWQDLVVVLMFGIAARLARRSWPVRIGYALLVLLAAADVPVQRALGSPLTMQMLRATSGTIGESILRYVTPGNVALTSLVLIIGVIAPFALRRWPVTPRWAIAGRLCFAIVLVGVGPIAERQVDTAGVSRNSALAFVQSTLPRIRPHPESSDWRASLSNAPATDDLSHLSGSAEKMNVLFVVLESTAARYLHPYGAADDPAPNLTRLASHAVVFDHAYAVYPESVKGIVAYLASRFPAFDITAERHDHVIAPSLATVLATRGYSTALFHSGRFMYLGMDRLLGHSGFELLLDAGDIGGNHNSSFGVDEPSTVAALLSWIDARRGTPFFAAYLPAAGHHPYDHEHPGPWSDSIDIGRYRNAVHEGDESLGTLVDGLRSRGLLRSTLIVVFGDHGEAFGQHPGNFAHTLAIYDENIRVPLLFVIPGAAAATRVGRTASLVDVAPTVLDLLGMQPPAEFQGSSLLPARASMALFFTDYSLGLLGLRDGCTKFIYEMESKRSRMFDLCSDPDETHDIAAANTTIAARYRALLERWSAAQVALVAPQGATHAGMQ